MNPASFRAFPDGERFASREPSFKQSLAMRPELLLLLVSLPVSTVSAAIYVPDLSGSAPGDPLEGIDGWSQSEPNVPGDSPLAWVSTIGTSLGAAVGGFYNEPLTDPFVASRPVNTPLAGSMLSLDLAIQDSTIQFPFRNDFFIGLSSGTTNLFSLAFNSVTPIPIGGDPKLLEAFWNVSVVSDAETPMPAFGAVAEDAIYSLNVGFIANGSDIDYSLDLVGNVGPVFSKSGTLSGLAGADIENFNLGFSQGQADGYGDNFLVIGGTEKVPDTGSTLALLGLSLAALLRIHSGFARKAG